MNTITRRTALAGAAALPLLPVSAFALPAERNLVVAAFREPESSFDYDACRRRLRAVTTDAAMLDSFDRMAASEIAGDAEAFDDEPRITRWNHAMKAFIENAIRLNISFDYIIGGRGEPFIAWARVMSGEETGAERMAGEGV